MIGFSLKKKTMKNPTVKIHVVPAWKELCHVTKERGQGAQGWGKPNCFWAMHWVFGFNTNKTWNYSSTRQSAPPLADICPMISI